MPFPCKWISKEGRCLLLIDTEAGRLELCKGEECMSYKLHPEFFQDKSVPSIVTCNKCGKEVSEYESHFWFKVGIVCYECEKELSAELIRSYVAKCEYCLFGDFSDFPDSYCKWKGKESKCLVITGTEAGICVYKVQPAKPIV